MTAGPRDLEPLLAHVTWVRDLALHLCGDVHAAEDAAQDTLAAAMRNPPRDPERARGFLARTLRNALSMRLRGERRRTRREWTAAAHADATVVDTSELVARAELHRHLVAAVLALPEAARELVLRHYFEGDDLATLACRARVSVDAVRAQLRRARERLRAGLEHDHDARHGFAMLVAATKLGATGTVTATTPGVFPALASTTGVITFMKVKVLLGAATAAAALWLLLPLLSPPTSAVDGNTTTNPSSVATAALPANLDSAKAVPTEESTELVRASATDALELRGRLDGLHPDAPWTTAMTLRVTGSSSEGRHEHDDRITVATDGTFTMTLPSWFRRATSVALRLAARDPFYLPTDAGFRPELDARERPITVAVEPVSVVTGRVVDPRGGGVRAARVGAFLPHAAPASGDVFMRCSTNTDAEGRYRMQVPMAASLLLVGLPMHEASLSVNHPTGENGAINDDNQHRDDLLPAHVRVTTRWGQITEAPVIWLSEPAYVTGNVVTDEGVAVAGAEVIWIHNAADGPSLYDRTLSNLMTWADGSTGRIALTKTDQNGRFRLPATAGKTGVCYPRDGAGRPEPFVEMVTTKPPADVAFCLAGEVATVRVLSGGLALSGVKVTTNSIGDRLTAPDHQRQTDERGEVSFRRSKRVSQQVVIAQPGRALVNVEIPTDTSPTTPFVVELPPLATATMRVEFDSDVRVRQVRLTWNRVDLDVVPLQQDRLRNDGDGPFEVTVPPGRYHLTVSAPSLAEQRDSFLFSRTEEVEVPLRGRDLRLPIAHGGRIGITMTDRDGRYAYGYISATSTVGTRFTWALGEPAQSSNVSPNLPPGAYDLVIQQKGKDVHRNGVQVRSCEVTDVRVRLP